MQILFYVFYQKFISFGFACNILAATYDIVSDNSEANGNVIGGGNYQISGQRLHRFGVETGVGITGTIKNWDLTLEYNAGLREDFQTHTGMLKAKYNF